MDTLKKCQEILKSSEFDLGIAVNRAIQALQKENLISLESKEGLIEKHQDFSENTQLILGFMESHMMTEVSFSFNKQILELKLSLLREEKKKEETPAPEPSPKTIPDHIIQFGLELAQTGRRDRDELARYEGMIQGRESEEITLLDTEDNESYKMRLDGIPYMGNKSARLAIPID